jgi:hypothetical protein
MHQITFWNIVTTHDALAVVQLLTLFFGLSYHNREDYPVLV